MRPQGRSEPAVATRESPRRETATREPQRREPPASMPANPFGGGFWRSVLKLGRKDERSQ